MGRRKEKDGGTGRNKYNDSNTVLQLTDIQAHVHESLEDLSSTTIPKSTQCLLRQLKITKGRATEVPSLENYRW